VIEASRLVAGMVYAGMVYSKEHPDEIAQRVPGEVIEDETVAHGLLPTLDGSFDGSAEYDEEHLNDVVVTRDWTARAIAAWKNGMPGDIYVSSSW